MGNPPSNKAGTGWPLLPLGDLLRKSDEKVRLDPSQTYEELTVKLWGRGVVSRGRVLGAEIAADSRGIVRQGQLVVSRIDARNGALGLVPPELDGAVASNDFPVFTPDMSRVLPEFLGWLVRSPAFVQICSLASEGTTNRVRLQEAKFLRTPVAVPPLPEQERIIARLRVLVPLVTSACTMRSELKGDTDNLLYAFADKILNPAQYPTIELGQLAVLTKRFAAIPEDGLVKSLGVRWWGRGAYIAEEKSATALRAARFQVKKNDLIYNDMWARHGSVAVVPENLDGAVASAHFPTWELDVARVVPAFLGWCFRCKWFWAQCELASQGSTGRNAIKKSKFKKLVMPLPPITEQQRLVAQLDSLKAQLEELQRLQKEASLELEALLPSILDKAFRGGL